MKDAVYAAKKELTVYLNLINVKKKIIDYFLKQAETGNWDKIKYSDVEKS